MVEVATGLVTIGMPILILGFWKFYREEKKEREQRSEWWKELSIKVEDAKKIAKGALILAKDLSDSKLEINRKIVDQSNLVKDKIVEIHNLQDHLSRTDKDVIDLNRTVSKRRPVYKIDLKLTEEINKKIVHRPKGKVKTRTQQ